MVQLGHTAAAVADAVEHADGAGIALVFKAGSLTCALPLAEIIETLRPLRIRPLAGTPDIVPGICIMRGVPAPVVDMAVLLTGTPGQVSRFVAVRTGHGAVALATGPVLGIQPTAEAPAAAATTGSLLGGTAGRIVAAVDTLDGEPLLRLHSMRHLPDEVWAAAAAAES